MLCEAARFPTERGRFPTSPSRGVVEKPGGLPSATQKIDCDDSRALVNNESEIS